MVNLMCFDTFFFEKKRKNKDMAVIFAVVITICFCLENSDLDVNVRFGPPSVFVCL